MNDATGWIIGNKVGKTREVDTKEDGSVVGRFLRVNSNRHSQTSVSGNNDEGTKGGSRMLV